MKYAEARRLKRRLAEADIQGWIIKHPTDKGAWCVSILKTTGTVPWRKPLYDTEMVEEVIAEKQARDRERDRLLTQQHLQRTFNGELNA